MGYQRRENNEFSFRLRIVEFHCFCGFSSLFDPRIQFRTGQRYRPSRFFQRQGPLVSLHVHFWSQKNVKQCSKCLRTASANQGEKGKTNIFIRISYNFWSQNPESLRLWSLIWKTSRYRMNFLSSSFDPQWKIIQYRVRRCFLWGFLMAAQAVKVPSYLCC